MQGKIKDKKFLVGSELSLADIWMVTVLNKLFTSAYSEKDRKRVPHWLSYYSRLMALPEFKTNLSDALPKFTAPLPSKKDSSSSSSSDDDKKKKKKKKKNKKKKKQPKKEPKKQVPKKKQVFAPTKINFHQFKTLYTNSKDKKQVIEDFLGKYEENAFSFWLLKYDKLDSECHVLFKTNNLMNGFLARAELVRKHAIGVHGVYGDEPTLDIRGLWIMRGTELVDELKDHDQFDVYFYEKLDPKKAEHKQLIVDYLTKLEEDKDVLEGRTLRTLRLFK